MDEENGLLYMRARYYDPEVGRFINKDPIGFEGGINFYSYVGNNPVNYSDPKGLFLWPYDCAMCFYYMTRCAEKGLECKKKKSECQEDLTSDELWKDCIQKNPDCVKMIEYCGKCSLLPKDPIWRIFERN